MKRTVILVLAAIMAFSLALDAVAQAKKVELTWWAYPRFTTAGKDPGVYEQEIADRYCKENPNVSIKVEALAYNGGPAKVNVAIATGAVPDMLIDDPIRLIADYAARGALEPMDDIVDVKNIQPGFLADCYFDGKMYMYPISALCYCIGVNKTAFEKAKALDKLPLNRPGRNWTWAEYDAALEAVKGLPGMYATAMWAGNEQGDSATRLLLQNWGWPMFTPGNKRFVQNNDAGVKGMEWILSLKKRGLLAPGAESLVMTDMVDLFNQGRVAVGTYYSSDQYAVLLGMQKDKKAPDFELVFFPYPTAPGVKSVTTLAQTGIGVFKNADPAKVAAAKKFIKWVCTTPDIVAMSQGHIPAVKGMPALGDTKKWSELQLMEKWGAANSVYSGRTLKGLSEIRTFWFPNLQAMILEKKSPKQALDDFVNSANQVMAKNYP